MKKERVLVPVIEIPDIVITKVETSLPTGTKISPTQIVRIGLLLLKQSKLSREQIFSLIGQSATDSLLIDSLEAQKK